MDGFLLINLTHTSEPSPVTHVDQTREILSGGYGWSLVLVLLGLATVLACLAPPVRRRLGVGTGFAAVGLGGVAALAWSLYALNGAADLFVVLPFAAIGDATLVLAVLRPWVDSSTLLSWRQSIPATLVTLALLGASAAQAMSQRDDRLEQQQASAAAVLGVVPSDVTILSLSAPQALVLTGRANPSRFQLFTIGFGNYVDDVWPGGIEGYADWFRSTKPELVAVDAKFEKGVLEDVLQDGYVRVGGAPTWLWYASVDLPPEQLQALRSALSRVRTQFSRADSSAVSSREKRSNPQTNRGAGRLRSQV